MLAAQAESAQMVDDMIQFVRTACQGNTQQALDVLQTGMAHQEGSGHDRLQLAMAEVHAANSNWAAVVEHAWPGKDEQATQLAQQAVKQSDDFLSREEVTPAKQQAHLEATTCLAGVMHATGDSEAALKQAAALRLAQGQLSEAAGLFGQACAAADQCQEAGSSTSLRPPVWQQQVAADVMLGAAQTAAAQHSWDKAEELLSKALNLAEQLHGGDSQTPQVGVVLGLLGHVYARSKRITLAEGLHRQAVKLLRVDPSASPSEALPVHSSLAAAGAWRYSQLLTALPRRDTEASAWKQFAAAHSPIELESVLGPLDILKGGKDIGSGIVVDLLMLRALPCWLLPASRSHTSLKISHSFSRKHTARKHGLIQASAVVESGVPKELEKIIGGFQMVPDPKIKYQQLLFYAKKLKPMAAALHTETNKVQGCVSQVWVHPRVEDGKIFWEADSDSALTKGLAALLVQGLSGSTAADIVAIPPDFIDRLGLQQSLTPSRNNGFLNMFRLMQRKSLDLVQTEEHGAQEAADMPKPVPSDSMVEQPIQESPAELKAQEEAQSPAQMSPSPVQAMQAALQKTFAPTLLEVQQHQQSSGSEAPATSENHMHIHVVSDQFEGWSDAERQKSVKQVVKKESPDDHRKLTIEAQTPEECTTK
ncbi:hypothetical protein WJX82_011690 [Trebouxia sp. C0006]